MAYDAVGVENGREILERLGMSENEEGLDAGDVAGFGVDMALDPWNLILPGLGLAGGALGGMKAAKYLNRAKGLGGQIDELPDFLKLMRQEDASSALAGLSDDGARAAAFNGGPIVNYDGYQSFRDGNMLINPWDEQPTATGQFQKFLDGPEPNLTQQAMRDNPENTLKLIDELKAAAGVPSQPSPDDILDILRGRGGGPTNNMGWGDDLGPPPPGPHTPADHINLHQVPEAKDLDFLQSQIDNLDDIPDLDDWVDIKADLEDIAVGYFGSKGPDKKRAAEMLDHLKEMLWRTHPEIFQNNARNMPDILRRRAFKDGLGGPGAQPPKPPQGPGPGPLPKHPMQSPDDILRRIDDPGHAGPIPPHQAPEEILERLQGGGHQFFGDDMMGDPMRGPESQFSPTKDMLPGGGQGELAPQGLLEAPIDPFSSGLDRAMEGLQGRGVMGDELLTRLPKMGVRQAELEDRGIIEFLRGKGKVSRGQLDEHLAANPMAQYEKVVAGGQDAGLAYEAALLEDAKNLDLHKYGSPENVPLGGSWEKSFSQHSVHELEDMGMMDKFWREYKDAFGGKPTQMSDIKGSTRDTAWQEYAIPGGDDYQEMALVLKRGETEFGPPGAGGIQRDVSTFTGQHSGFPDDTFAHIRYDTRHTPDGKKGYLLHEAQSDWHQQAGEVAKSAAAGRLGIPWKLKDDDYAGTFDEVAEALNLPARPSSPEVWRGKEVAEWDKMVMSEHKKAIRKEARVGDGYKMSAAERKALRDRGSELHKSISKSMSLDGKARNSSSEHLHGLRTTAMNMVGGNDPGQLDRFISSQAKGYRIPERDLTEYLNIHMELMGKHRLPDAPLKQDWDTLAFKELVDRAVKDGMDFVAIAPGERIADKVSALGNDSYKGIVKFMEDVLPKKINKALKRDKNGKLEIIKVAGFRGLSGQAKKDQTDMLAELSQRMHTSGVAEAEIDNLEKMFTAINHEVDSARDLPVYALRLTPDIKKSISRKGQSLYSLAPLAAGGGAAAMAGSDVLSRLQEN